MDNHKTQIKELFDFFNKNQQALDSLIDAMKRGLVIPFIGAGMSVPIYPTWIEFLTIMIDNDNVRQQAKETATTLISEGKFERAASVLQDELGKADFIDEVKHIFQDTKIIKGKYSNMPISFLPQIFRNRTVITTNFDRLLDKVFDDAGCAFKDSLSPYEPSVVVRGDFAQGVFNYLLKLHGDYLSTDKIAFTESQYDEYYGKDLNSEYVTFMSNALSQNILLFLGCSLEVDRTMQLLEKVALSQHRKHYAVLECPSDSFEDDIFHEKRKRLSNMGITCLWYPNRRHEFVDVILKEIKNHTADEIKGTTGKTKKIMLSLIAFCIFICVGVMVLVMQNSQEPNIGLVRGDISGTPHDFSNIPIIPTNPNAEYYLRAGLISPNLGYIRQIPDNEYVPISIIYNIDCVESESNLYLYTNGEHTNYVEHMNVISSPPICRICSNEQIHFTNPQHYNDILSIPNERGFTVAARRENRFSQADFIFTNSGNRSGLILGAELNVLEFIPNPHPVFYFRFTYDLIRYENRFRIDNIQMFVTNVGFGDATNCIFTIDFVGTAFHEKIITVDELQVGYTMLLGVVSTSDIIYSYCDDDFMPTFLELTLDYMEMTGEWQQVDTVLVFASVTGYRELFYIEDNYFWLSWMYRPPPIMHRIPPDAIYLNILDVEDFLQSSGAYTWSLPEIVRVIAPDGFSRFSLFLGATVSGTVTFQVDFLLENNRIVSSEIFVNEIYNHQHYRIYNNRTYTNLLNYWLWEDYTTVGVR